MNIKDLLQSSSLDDKVLGLVTMTRDQWVEISDDYVDFNGECSYDRTLSIKDGYNYYVVIINKDIYEITKRRILSISREKQEKYLKISEVKDYIVYNDNSIEKYATRDVEI